MKKLKNRLWLLLLGLLFLASISRPAIAMDSASGSGSDEPQDLFNKMAGTMMITIGLTLCRKPIMMGMEYIRDEQFFAAVKSGFSSLIQPYLKLGVDVNMKDGDGATPLFYAVWYGHTPQARLLIDAGADIEIINNNGSTPLIVASSHNNDDMVRLLLDAGARVDFPRNGKNGMTSLMLAVLEGKPSGLSVLKNLIIGSIDQLEQKAQCQVAVVSDHPDYGCGDLVVLPVEIRSHIAEFVGVSGYGALQSTCKQLRGDIAGNLILRSKYVKEFICSRLHEYINRVNNAGDTALMLAHYRNNVVPSQIFQEIIKFLTPLSTQEGVREFMEGYMRAKEERVGAIQ